MPDIDFVVGLPPDLPTDEAINGRTNTLMRNSMPVAKIYPGIPSFQKGLDLFQRQPAFYRSGTGGQGGGGRPRTSNANTYLQLLNEHNFTIDLGLHQGFLKIAYLADSFPTDSFSNEYGENFLQKFTDVASEGAASISQMFGGRRATEVIGGAIEAIKETGQLGQQVGGIAQNLNEGFRSFITRLGAQGGLGGSIGGAANLVDALVAGSRIDFPMVWKTSAYQPSYTMTVRLYNPNPSSSESTRKYIAAPIAALMLLGIPQSVDGSTYSWPFIHRIHSPGIYDLDPAFISNISVIKGGDQQQIAFGQQLGMVDVRIDFGSLFSTILAGGRRIGKTRPTLEKYINGLLDQKPGVVKFSTDYSSSTPSNEDVVVNPVITQTTRDTSPTYEDESTEIPSRVNSQNQSRTVRLVIDGPSGFFGR